MTAGEEQRPAAERAISRRGLLGAAGFGAIVAASAFGEPSAFATTLPLPGTDVTFYGADPTGVKDSSHAINAALAAASRSPSARTVTLPAGDYLCESPLLIGNGTTRRPSPYDGVTLEGSGISVTRLIPGRSLKGCLIKIAGPLQGFGLRNLFLDNSPHNVRKLTGILVVSGQNGAGQYLRVRDFETCLGETTGRYNTTRNKWRSLWLQPQRVPYAAGIRCGIPSAKGKRSTCFEDFNLVAVAIPHVPRHLTYGAYFGCADTISMSNVIFETWGPDARAVVWDYTNGVTRNWPAGVLIDGVDFAPRDGGKPFINVGTPGPRADPHVIRCVNTTNGYPAADPNIPNCYFNPEKYTPHVKTPAVPRSGVVQAASHSVPVTVYLTTGASAAEVLRVRRGDWQVQDPPPNVVTPIATVPAHSVGTIHLSPGDGVILHYRARPHWAWAYR